MRRRSPAAVSTQEQARAHTIINMPPEILGTTRDVIARTNVRNWVSYGTDVWLNVTSSSAHQHQYQFNLFCCFLSALTQPSSNSSTRASKVVFAVFAFGTILYTPTRQTAVGVIVNVGVLGMAWDQGVALFVILCSDTIEAKCRHTPLAYLCKNRGSDTEGQSCLLQLFCYLTPCLLLMIVRHILISVIRAPPPFN